MNGVLIIDKPADFTSFDVVAIARGITHQRKIGHTGTLDPMATGVLPLLLGASAKAQGILPDSDKEYVAELKLGISTDTLDITGKILNTYSCHINKDEFEASLLMFLGKQLQLPPMYSAIRHNGVRLYELARQGIELERERRPINIKEIELLSFDEDTQSAKIRVLCSKGTYIRSLISDIGRKLGADAVMTALRRTKACGYSIDDTITIEKLRELKDDEESILKLLHSTESIFNCYDELFVSEAQAKRFGNGGTLEISRTKIAKSHSDETIYRIKSPTGVFEGLGITDCKSGQIKIYKLFARGD